MGNMSAILAALFCATAPAQAIDVLETKTEQSAQAFRLGKETVSSIRSAYEKGEYNEFLTEMNISYEKAVEENDLSGLIQMRQKEIPADFQEKWEEKFAELQKMKNEELKAVVSDQDDSLFAKKVRSLAADLSTAEQDKAISMLNALIAKVPGQGAHEDENKLIAIDLEYEYKILHAQMPLIDVSPEKMLQHQLALRMEKMDRMLEAAKNFEDTNLKQAVSLAAANFDARLARNLDGIDLASMVRSKVKPSNDTEKKVFSILESYQGQFVDLMKQIDNENR